MELSVDVQALIVALSSAGVLTLVALLIRLGFILIVIRDSTDKPRDASMLLRAMKRNAPAELEADDEQKPRGDGPGAAHAPRTRKRRRRRRAKTPAGDCV